MQSQGPKKDSIFMEENMGVIEQSFNVRYSAWAREVLEELNESFTITDPLISGHPIVFASRGFLKLCGYSRNEVVGRNGRMFQGVATNRRSVMEIREAIREERSLEISIVNYRKDGAPFWMLFCMSPVFSKEDGRVINFVGVQVPIVERASGRGRLRNGVDSSDERSGVHEVALGCCRKEVLLDAMSGSGCVSSLDSSLSGDRELARNYCEASDAEKRKASTTMNNILSVLTHYSELTGRLVCVKRCCLPDIGFLCASLNASLGRIKQSFVLTDPHLPNMPIVYASDAFLELTGYDRHEVLGQNCRFLSGMETKLSIHFQIRDSVQSGKATTVCILNYRKNSSAFWNFVHISPVRDASGKVKYFVEVQVEAGCTVRDQQELGPDKRQLSVVAAVKVAVRSSSMAAVTANLQ